ncbi:MAG TPA: SRPBCC domain-containing protein [Acidimicrobiia bacterium]|nr:SRPBCC domain-containing protein [Acidimicrobiia bacterium]
MGDDRTQVVTGTVDVSPERVFAVLSDPARHTEIDGAGMLRGLASSSGPVTRVGDSWVMNMNQPNLGDYQMRSEVIAFEPDRRISWAPAIHPPDSLAHLVGDLDFGGYYYGWELAPNADGGTDIIHTYDWSGVKDERTLEFFPRVTSEQMAETINRLGQAAATT